MATPAFGAGPDALQPARSSSWTTVRRTAAQKSCASARRSWLVTQPNAGECAACAIADRRATTSPCWTPTTWEPDFWRDRRDDRGVSGCGVYSTAFNIVSHDGRFGPHPLNVVWSLLLPRLGTGARSVKWRSTRVFEAGGFPEGTKIGGDMYM